MSCSELRLAKPSLCRGILSTIAGGLAHTQNVKLASVSLLLCVATDWSIVVWFITHIQLHLMTERLCYGLYGNVVLPCGHLSVSHLTWYPIDNWHFPSRMGHLPRAIWSWQSCTPSILDLSSFKSFPCTPKSILYIEVKWVLKSSSLKAFQSYLLLNS